MPIKQFAQRLVEANKKLLQETEEQKEDIIALTQQVACLHLHLVEAQKKIDTMLYCLGQECADHRNTKDFLTFLLLNREDE